MDKNPLEQQKTQIEALREEMKGKFGHLFDNKDELKDRIGNFILQLEAFEKSGLIFDKEKIIRGVKESANINDREAFIAHFVKILEPFTILRVTQSKIFEKVARDETIKNSGNLRLSEILYANFENEVASIHLAPAAELKKEIGFGNFKKEIEKGLIKLAEIIKSDEKIKEIWAVSWIVARHPLLLKRLGFTIAGELTEEEKIDGFSEEKRPVARAFMKREDFLARYGTL